MKTAQFTNMHLEHFGKHENIQSELGHRTVIEGANATGKSTIKRAVQYILGTKDENGKEISGIRPHDTTGVDIDGLTTVAELTVSVDGAENTLKRTCFQEKNRQGEYTGKDNLQYFVDDVKKGTKKAYDEYISTIIPATVCISAQELLMKDTAGRRSMLEVFSKHDTDGIIDENPDFEPIRGKLRANTVADLKKSCRDKIKDKTKQRDAFPARIDEVEKQKVDIDLAELELLKNALNEQIAENKEKQANVDKQFEEYDRQSKDILDLQFELNGLQQKANLDLEKKCREIRMEIDKVDRQLKEVAHQAYLNQQDIERAESAISNNTDRIESCRQKWTSLNSQLSEEKEHEFDENSLICSYCGQEYPADKKEQLRAEFESHKVGEIKRIKEEIENVTAQGNKWKSAIEKDKAEIEQLKATLKENEDEEINLKESIKGLEKCLEEIPRSIDISDREDVKQLKQQIAEKEQAMQKGNSASKIRQQLQSELEDLQRQLNEVEVQFLEVKKNEEKDNHIAELKKQQLALSQEIADIERELDLLKRFERKKAELLEADVNENFDLVQFRMFEKMVGSDDLKDVCHILVDGESYDRNLNFSNRLLAEVDICRGFQRKYDVELPILLDNAESIDKERIPNVSNQLILFQRADCEELTIECLED